MGWQAQAEQISDLVVDTSTHRDFVRDCEGVVVDLKRVPVRPRHLSDGSTRNEASPAPDDRGLPDVNTPLPGAFEHLF